METTRRKRTREEVRAAFREYLDEKKKRMEEKQRELDVQKTVDIHPPKTGISVHFSDSFILMALQI